MNKILALDYGGKRIGIAISDPDQTVAFPREVLENRGFYFVVNHLKKLIQEEGIEAIVVGWPISMEGNMTKQTHKTQDFIDQLKENLEVEIFKMDERLSSVQAEKTGGDDSVAAQILLQTHLNMVK